MYSEAFRKIRQMATEAAQACEDAAQMVRVYHSVDDVLRFFQDKADFLAEDAMEAQEDFWMNRDLFALIEHEAVTFVANLDDPRPGTERALVDAYTAYWRSKGLNMALANLRAFSDHMELAGPTKLTHTLVCNGVIDPSGTCDCTDDEASVFGRHPYHRLYNRAMWEIMGNPVRIQQLRDVLRRDLKREKQRVAKRRYAEALLTNFVTARPNPDWVGAV